MTSDEIQRFREQIPAVEREGRTHLNNCSTGPIPQPGLDARRECERLWIEKGNPWDDWMDRIDESKRLFADLINASEDEIAILSNASQAFAQVASAFDYEDRNEVVTTDLEFPTVPYFWHGQRKRGAEMRLAESRDGLTVSTETYEEQMSDDTLLVCSAHAYPFTGGLMDVEGVADAVHDHGGYFFLDAYQSTGIMPIDVEKQNVDMLVSGTLKFLMGGPGTAYLYVDDDVVTELEPANLGWFGVEDLFDFSLDSKQYAAGARRFEMGTPAAPTTYMAAAGMEFVLEYGVENVRGRVVEHTNNLIAGVEERGFEIRTPRDEEKRGGVVNVQVENVERIEQELLDRGFNVSERAGGIRLSPHFYNTAAEIEQAVETLDEIATPASLDIPAR